MEGEVKSIAEFRVSITAGYGLNLNRMFSFVCLQHNWTDSDDFKSKLYHVLCMSWLNNFQLIMYYPSPLTSTEKNI